MEQREWRSGAEGVKQSGVEGVKKWRIEPAGNPSSLG